MAPILALMPAEMTEVPRGHSIVSVFKENCKSAKAILNTKFFTICFMLRLCKSMSLSFTRNDVCLRQAFPKVLCTRPSLPVSLDLGAPKRKKLFATTNSTSTHTEKYVRKA
eukprot:4796047-Amphidinium_carterae.1